MNTEEHKIYKIAVERLNFLKSQFDEHVIDTSKSIRETRTAISKIEERGAASSQQMSRLDNKLDKIFETLNDDKYSKKKGITTQTIENSDRISLLEGEAKAWKRAAVLVGSLLSGLGVLIAYFWKLLVQVIKP